MTEIGFLQRQADRGQQADNLLENPVFKEVAEKIREDFAKAFKGDDEDKALEARRQIRVFETLLTEITAVRGQGVVAMQKLREIQRRKKEGLSTDINDMKGIA